MQDPAPFAITITRITPENGRMDLPELTDLLLDTVESGASIGFLPPLHEKEACAYWEAILQDIEQGSRMLLVAQDAGKIIGAVQIELAMKPNALHRAEIQKLFVLRSYRRRGVAQRLMRAIEQAAQAQGRTLLVLDTRQGDAAERLYRASGYIEAGFIPSYARNADGGLDATIIFYKLLS